MNKKLLLINTLFLYIFSGIFIFMPKALYFNKKIEFNSNNFHAISYADKGMGGNSEIIESNFYKSEITLSWKTREGYKYPFAGLVICPKDSGFINLKYFDFIKIDFNKGKSSSFYIYLHYNIKNHSKKDDPTTTLIKRAFIEEDINKKSTIIPINKMVTPEWWYSQNKNLKNIKTTPKEILSISIEDGNSNQFEKIKTLNIKSISTGIDKSLFTFKLFIYLLILPLFFVLRQTYSTVKKRLFPENLYYIKSQINDFDAKEEDRLIDYIHNNYSNPNLSKKSLIQNLDISSDKISIILAKRYNQKFREFLNNIRLNKASELIKTTDMTITEISFETGFQQPSSFNRSFKKRFGKSPREFRNDNNN